MGYKDNIHVTFMCLTFVYPLRSLLATGCSTTSGTTKQDRSGSYRKWSPEVTIPRPGTSIGDGLLTRNRMCSSQRDEQSSQRTMLKHGSLQQSLKCAVDSLDS